ncbi:hypothetical protein ABIA00_006142 [Bradyrhizobium ottawaense]
MLLSRSRCGGLRSSPEPVVGGSGATRTRRGSSRRGLSRHAPPAMLSAQDSQYPGQGPALSTGQREEGSARSLLAPNRASAEVAIDVFAEKNGAKYDKTVKCLTKDRDAMLAFYEFSAEHWDQLRTTNPIESVFATVPHRTVRTKGSLSSTTAKLMVFKLLCTRPPDAWRTAIDQSKIQSPLGKRRDPSVYPRKSKRSNRGVLHGGFRLDPSTPLHRPQALMT